MKLPCFEEPFALTGRRWASLSSVMTDRRTPSIPSSTSRALPAPETSKPALPALNATSRERDMSRQHYVCMGCYHARGTRVKIKLPEPPKNKRHARYSRKKPGRYKSEGNSAAKPGAPRCGIRTRLGAESETAPTGAARRNCRIDMMIHLHDTGRYSDARGTPDSRMRNPSAVSSLPRTVPPPPAGSRTARSPNSGRSW